MTKPILIVKLSIHAKPEYNIYLEDNIRKSDINMDYHVIFVNSGNPETTFKVLKPS